MEAFHVTWWEHIMYNIVNVGGTNVPIIRLMMWCGNSKKLNWLSKREGINLQRPRRKTSTSYNHWQSHKVIIYHHLLLWLIFGWSCEFMYFWRLISVSCKLKIWSKRDQEGKCNKMGPENNVLREQIVPMAPTKFVTACPLSILHVE